MGIINATPDSFSDGGSLYRGQRLDLDAAMERARSMCVAGATILDVGGESTRPGADPVSEGEELERVVPLVERIAAELDVVISIDTSSAAVMRETAAVGAGLINDVRALERPGALEAAAATGLPVCLMHMQGQPGTMQQRPDYTSVVEEVAAYLEARMAACEAAGIGREQLVLDPGFGFGKTLSHNLQLLQALPRIEALGAPLLVGLSRKSLIGKILERDVHERLAASLALAVLAVERGAWIVRTHDVRETADAIAMCTALAGVADAEETT
ncbi:dihydropteroate synthase [Parahaliea maris]|uniref:dihydropteroate synthase n=1 Tax=Parahaliea maris TaxID=2716870 RepID=A0A5C9AB71_9GAMM|nr:dihydropteroate synthase [Parahaliea maris]TXS96797.1 dihydropteroate synthase [Parahaliea maris]